MREYGQIQSSYWTHPDIQSLSTDTKLLGAYLLTCQHTNGLGCFRMPSGYIAIDLSINIETVKEGLLELLRNGFLRWCDKTEYVLIPDFLRWNPIINPNSAKARAKEFEVIPSKSGVYPNLINALLKYSKYFEDDFISRLEQIKDGLPNHSGMVPEDVRDNKNKNKNKNKPLPEQEQEQEQNNMAGKPAAVEKPETAILEKLNILTGKNFKPVESNLKLIRARLAENHTTKELLDVVEMKVEKWQGGKMDEYLRPATLFNAEKFNQYVGELPEWLKEQSGDYSWLGEENFNVIDGEVVNG